MSSTAISSSSLFSAHYDECPPIHVYDTETSRPVAVVLRPRQDAERRRGARRSAPPGTAYPHATRHRELFCAATLRRATRPSPGIANGAPFRIEVTMLGLDIRFVVTSLDVGSAEWIYDSLYCARGQAENLIKLHKTQLASDRTSCRQ